MKIATYCISFPEEHQIIMNMVNQARKLGDVWVIDGGPDNHLCHHPNPNLDPWALQRLSETEGFIYTRMLWPGNPGAQRNAALKAMEPYDYDWIIHNDSDELWPDQSIDEIPALLEGLPEHVATLRVKVFPFVEDERHYSKNWATYLTHGRIHRAGTVWWGETWHEHQFFRGQQTITDLWLLHTNWLFINRLKRIKGHGLEGWNNVDKTPIPEDLGLTWPQLIYPDEDRVRGQRA